MDQQANNGGKCVDEVVNNVKTDWGHGFTSGIST